MVEFPSHFRACKHSLIQPFLPTGQLHILLDVGAGAGLTQRLLHVSPHTRYISLDCDHPSLHLCPGEKVLADALYYPFRRKSTDILLLLDVLEHILPDEQVLENCWNILSPDGLLFISVPRKIQPLCFISPEEEGHVRSGYDFPDLYTKARSVGFKLFYGKYLHSAVIAFVEDCLQKTMKIALRTISIPGMKGFSSDLVGTKGVLTRLYTKIFTFLAPFRNWIERKTPPSLMRSLILVLKKDANIGESREDSGERKRTI